MKRILFIIPIAIMFFFVACDPNEDLYDELGPTIINHTFNIEGTFTDADYETVYNEGIANAETTQDSLNLEFIRDNQMFSTEASAAVYAPYYLNTTYTSYAEGSSALMTYFYTSNMNLASKYTLDTPDYEAMGTAAGEPGFSEYFSDEINPDDFIPAWLPSKYPDAEAGVTQGIAYDYSSNGAIEVRTSFYTLKSDGTWVPFVGSTTYFMTDEDYETMGGAVGNYHNFSTSARPNDFIPNFLNIKFPYGFGDNHDTIASVVYNYRYNDVTKSYCVEYTFDRTEWSVLQKTEQYLVFSTGWKYDPTVTIVMNSDDYQSVVNYVMTTDQAFLVDSYGNAEYYHGSSSYYTNFDRRITKRRSLDPEGYPDTLSDRDAFDLILARVNEGVIIFLQSSFSDAQPQQNGIDVFFNVSYNTYNDPGVGEQRTVETVKLQCTAAASGATPPQFTVVEDTAVNPI